MVVWDVLVDVVDEFLMLAEIVEKVSTSDDNASGDAAEEIELVTINDELDELWFLSLDESELANRLKGRSCVLLGKFRKEAGQTSNESNRIQVWTNILNGCILFGR